jgi:class 3 adenylate cyclase
MAVATDRKLLTLLFTDLEGSSELCERFGADFEEASARHFEILRELAQRWNGVDAGQQAIPSFWSLSVLSTLSNLL